MDYKNDTISCLKMELAELRSQSVDDLIAGFNCDKNRGKIELIDELIRIINRKKIK